MLRAGVGRRDISNRTPLFLVGYPHVDRISDGVGDPLYTTALYLEDGGSSAIIVAVDILFVHHETVRQCRERISAATGVSPDRIMITATHTHSGPVTCDILSWEDDRTVPRADADYMRLFMDGIVSASVEAARASGKAEIAVARAISEGVGGNRLHPDGPRDPEVGLLVVRRKADKNVMGILMVYSMHPTVLHEDSRKVSSDFPGYTRAFLEDRWSTSRVLYHTGPCGNLSPRYHVKGQTFAEAQRLGETLGSQVNDVLEHLEDGDFSDTAVIDGAIGKTPLPPRQFCTVEEAKRELADAVAEYERLKAAGAPHGPVRTAECTVFGAEERVTLAQAQEKGRTDAVRAEYNPASVQVLRVGDICLVGFPGECFVEYALALKEAIPGTYVISLANGELQGYIPTPDATGYEARLSFFEPQAGERLVDCATRLIGQLRR